MLHTRNLLFLFLFFAINASASVVAIIDSGTDFQHKELEPKAWINPLEIPNNDRDEDRNGYQDDVNGWNFAENNSMVIDYSYLGTLTEDVRKFFTIQQKAMIGTATEAEIAWLREMVQKPEFIKQLQIYGNFMHGTHVAGIAARGSRDAKIIAAKIIPTEVKLPGQDEEQVKAPRGPGLFILKKALGLLATQQMVMLTEVADYLNNHKTDIANGSFGTGYPQAKQIVTMLANILIKNPTEADIEEATMHFLNTLISEGKKMLEAAPKTLFIFASGNDGLDNNKFPISPTNLQGDNVISVAATIGGSKLAPFSNYGKTMVDVAAPGVGINSTVPGNKYLKVSGTSQAAPYVAGIAAQVKDANPALSPKEIKAIILKTVDERDFLKGKVITNGIVNASRAGRAGELSRTMNLAMAITQSQVDILDQGVSKINISSQFEKGFVLPLQKSFIIKK